MWTCHPGDICDLSNNMLTVIPCGFKRRLESFSLPRSRFTVA